MPSAKHVNKQCLFINVKRFVDFVEKYVFSYCIVQQSYVVLNKEKIP